MELPVLHHHVFFHDETERRRWQNPEVILAEIGLKSGMTFVDVGCGEGFFALPAARIVGEKGKVFGLDIYEEGVRNLEKKAFREGIRNLVLKIGAAEETILCEHCADIVFLGIDLHDFRDATRVLANAKRMLKPTGRLIDLDWKKEPMPIGPPLNIRFSQEKATSLIEAAGFEIDTARESGPYHYVIIANPRRKLQKA